MADMEATVKAMAEQMRRAAAEEQVDQYARVIAKAYEHASGYTKTVTAIGYATLLGVWGFAGRYMPARPHAAAGILAIASASVFVLWEVYNNVRTARMFSIWAKKMAIEPPQDAVKNLLAYDEQRRRAQLRSAPTWYVVLIVTVLTGLGAAAILVFHALRFILSRP